MEIHSILPTARPAVTHRGTVHAYDLVGPGGLTLSRRDVELIRKATGVFFNWPPGKDEGFPEAAAEVALARIRKEAAGQPWNGLDADTLRDLRRLGLITQAGLNRALDSSSDSTGAPATEALPTVHEAAMAAAFDRPSVTNAAALYL